MDSEKILGFTALGAGLFLMYAAYKGISPLQVFTAKAQAATPATAANATAAVKATGAPVAGQIITPGSAAATNQ